MTEELYLNDERVDLKPGKQVTRNYKSNLLGDVSKITSSNSQTIHLPKTVRNRRILGNPMAVAYNSTTRYKRFRARYVKNGIEVMRVAYAVLLDSSAEYEVAIYWGIMANFQAWVDRGAKLSDLEGTESLAWNSSSYAPTVAVMRSTGYGYASYDCGVSDTSRINIHPSATAWWILNKIASQAGFTFDMPGRYEDALRTIAIPCLHKNSSQESWDAEKTSVLTYCRTIREFLGMDPNTGGAIMDYAVGYINVKSSTQTLPVYLGNNVAYAYYANWKWDTSGGTRWPVGTDRSTVYMAEFSTLSLGEMEIYINALSVNLASSTSIIMYVKKDDAAYTEFKIWKIQAWQTIREVVDCTGFDRYYFILKDPKQESAAYEVNIEITPYTEEMTYPSVFRICPNLPEIAQIDFIKTICAILGIFVTADPSNDNNLKFVSLDVLQANKTQAVDWSEKLVRSNEDEPKTVKFKIADYCRNNLFKYKEDDTVETKGDGNLTIDNEALEREKVVITLPFASSDGGEILHYKSNGDDVDTVSIKDRIMNIVADRNGRAALTFDGLDFASLLSEYYSVMSDMLNSAIVICERFTLSEYDLKQIDYTIPFYLRQYGKYYGIINIQDSSDSEVEAVQLPAN